MEYRETQGVRYEVMIEGLAGGHSGAEIDKIRANAIKLLGRFCLNFRGRWNFSYRACRRQKGQCDSEKRPGGFFLADACAEKEIAEAAAEFGKNLRAEYSGTDDGISVNVRTEGETEGSALTMSAQQKVFYFSLCSFRMASRK